jgi:hypothetical protein
MPVHASTSNGLSSRGRTYLLLLFSLQSITRQSQFKKFLDLEVLKLQVFIGEDFDLVITAP